GEAADHVVAFARRLGNEWAIVAVPRLVTSLPRTGGFPLGPRAWGDTVLALPSRAPATWTDAPTGAEIAVTDGSLPLEELFRILPVAFASRHDPRTLPEIST